MGDSKPVATQGPFPLQRFVNEDFPSQGKHLPKHLFAIFSWEILLIIKKQIFRVGQVIVYEGFEIDEWVRAICSECIDPEPFSGYFNRFGGEEGVFHSGELAQVNVQVTLLCLREKAPLLSGRVPHQVRLQERPLAVFFLQE